MPTRPKPVEVLRIEGKSHRTKAELEKREKAESGLLSGRKMRESKRVRENPRAHEVFRRVRQILGAIKKDDALYEAVINRYCLIAAEVDEYGRQRERLEKRADELDRLLADGAMDEKEHCDEMGRVLEMEIDVDAMLQKKRKMLLDIEKENVMTVASALRAIPKQPEDEGEADPMTQLLAQRMAR